MNAREHHDAFSYASNPMLTLLAYEESIILPTPWPGGYSFVVATAAPGARLGRSDSNSGSNWCDTVGDQGGNGVVTNAF